MLFENEGYFRMKYYDFVDDVVPERFASGQTNGNTTNFPLMRYADVLLMKSEAKVRNGENGDEELNRVRSRVAAPYREATLNTLLDERQLEFAWEGWRRQDLVRFGLFTRPYSSRPQLAGEASGYTTVFPIPDKVRRMNPNLVQNPGYK